MTTVSRQEAQRAVRTELMAAWARMAPVGVSVAESACILEIEPTELRDVLHTATKKRKETSQE